MGVEFKAGRLILYAPNVRSGGGWVLLRALLAAWPGDRFLCAFLDKRVLGRLTLPEGCDVTWVGATFRLRLWAEFKLQRICGFDDTVFCLHNLPPALAVRGTVVVFHQNRILLRKISLWQFPLLVALRISAERLLARMFCHRVSQYIVQTPSMAHDLAQWYNGRDETNAPLIRVLPFMEKIAVNTLSLDNSRWDFVYVASGEAHKNHARLLDAWRELAAQGIRPSLALTLGTADKEAIALVHAFEAQGHSNVVNLGQLPYEDLMALYQRTKAIIFPSLSESFGLPLIEAAFFRVPILASELDFVRDVCQPVQTFDPFSAHSIARSVKRFLGIPDDTICLLNPAEFWAEFFNDRSTVTL